MDLIGFLNSNGDARKVFGEREIKIIEKQLTGVDLTQSEKNRLSRDIRKKFQFIKEAFRFVDDFDLVKGDYVKRAVGEAVELILEDKLFGGVKSIIQFGSSIDGSMRLDSDIDLAVVFDDIDLKTAGEFLKRINAKVPDKVDLSVYNTLDVKVRDEIDERGRQVFAR